jgi:hypothetical protein
MNLVTHPLTEVCVICGNPSQYVGLERTKYIKLLLECISFLEVTLSRGDFPHLFNNFNRTLKALYNSRGMSVQHE